MTSIDRVALVTTNQVDLGVRAIASGLRAGGRSVSLLLASPAGTRCSGEARDELVRASFSVDSVGISALSCSWQRSRKLARALAESDHRVVIGGLYPTLHPDDSIEAAPNICLGEADEALSERLRNWAKPCRLPSFRLRGDESRVFPNEREPVVRDLDAIVPSDFSSERAWRREDERLEQDDATPRPLKDHQIGGLGTFVCVSDRVCPLACAFCCPDRPCRIHRRQTALRFEGVDRTDEDLHAIVDAYHPRLLHSVHDDSCARPVPRIESSATSLKGQIRLPLVMMGTPGLVTRRELDALVAAALQILTVGFQSGLDRVLREIHDRHADTEQGLETARLVSECTDSLTINYESLTNSPFDIQDDLPAMIELVRRLPPPIFLVTHNLVVEDGGAPWKLGRQRGFRPKRERERSSESHFHDSAHLDDRPERVPPNRIPEGMRGFGDGAHRGRLPRRLVENQCDAPLAAAFPTLSIDSDDVFPAPVKLWRRGAKLSLPPRLRLSCSSSERAPGAEWALEQIPPRTPLQL